MRPFRVIRPTKLEEVPVLLKDRGRQAAVLAGGTDLLVDLRFGKPQDPPQWLVSLNCLEGDLAYISRGAEGELRLGALTRLRDVERSPLVRAGGWTALAEGAGSVGSVQVRNLATLGGNICRASPAADTVPALVALGASLILYGGQGSRTVPAERFFTGPGKTDRQQDEALIGVVVPAGGPRSGGVYLKHGLRGAMEIAIVGVAAVGGRDEAGRWTGVRIALGAVGPTVLRAEKAETLLNGHEPAADLHRAAAELAAEECSPIDDVRAGADYRRAMVRVYVRRALEILDARIKGTGG